jgi:hypothetical protein
MLYQPKLRLGNDLMGHERSYIVPGAAGRAKPALETEPKRLAAGVLNHINSFFGENFGFHDFRTFLRNHFRLVGLFFHRMSSRGMKNYYNLGLTSQHNYSYNPIRNFMYLEIIFNSRGFRVMPPSV